MTQTILVVDDKLNVQKLLTDFLSQKGFRVLSASNGRDAQLILKKQIPDLILLDIMMPQMDGYEFISKLRETSDMPVIMITAKQQESDVVKGFELGADDYIAKPFRMSELLARVKAVLKRTSLSFSQNSRLKVANLNLDSVTNELRIDNKLVELTLAELTLLSLLMQSVEHAVSKAEICRHLIEEGYSGSESTLKIHIRNLRNKLYPLVKEQVIIESVFGVGYRLRKVQP
ncbi:response regulator transcription factor [Photobacterium sp. OFAV2-7]|uniref:response regulator transcription factor n=1 Tax=Photobacterium sp. OFAV2-7 TaxID=2917748 RepID=UPI001EF6BFA9|nr:response regulator transcription factor [Photobacterium sp. OFAV2-7]MCG7587949.1 response regulator transcription factor [Photobacterium sp. OFAV2-7]